MGAYSFESIAKDLKAGKYAPVYFFAGEEPFYAQQLLQLIEKGILDESERSFNQTVLYGKETNMLQILEEAKRFPMMSERIVVVVKDLPIADGVITVLVKQAREGNNARSLFIGPGQVSQETVSCRPQSCHQAGPGGAANRYVAIGAVKAGPLAGQLVDVGRYHKTLPVTAQLRS